MGSKAEKARRPPARREKRGGGSGRKGGLSPTTVPKWDGSGVLGAAEVLSLQRTAGNEATRRLLDRRRAEGGHSSDVQRTVTFGAGKKPINADMVLDLFKAYKQAEYQRGLVVGMDDATLLTIFDEYVQDNNKATYYSIVHQEVVKEIVDREKYAAAFAADGAVGAVQYQVQNVAANFPEGLDIQFEKGKAEKSIDSKWMSIKAGVALQGPRAEVQQWEVGFVQTVMALQRDVQYSDKGQNFQYRSFLPKQKRDGPSGSRGPWYDVGTYKGFKNSFDAQEVEIRDRPGLDFTLTDSAEVKGMSGGDKFKTWLVLRKKDGSAVRFLGMWSWDVDWSYGDGKVGKGIQNVVGPVKDEGADAIFEGSAAKDRIQGFTDEI